MTTIGRLHTLKKNFIKIRGGTVLKPLRYLLFCCSAAILLPSYGYSMNQGKGDPDYRSSKSGGKKHRRSSTEEKSEKPTQHISKKLQILSQSTMTSFKTPLSYEFLLIKYGYSPEYMVHERYYKGPKGYEPLKFNKITPYESPDVTAWKEKREEWIDKYKAAYRHYNRAQGICTKNIGYQSMGDLTKLESTKNDFQPILREILRKHGSAEAKIKVREIEEELEKGSTEGIVNTDLYTDYNEELLELERKLIYLRFSLHEGDPENKSAVGYSLEPTEIKPALYRLRKLIAQKQRENLIIEDVIYLYNKYYLDEVSSSLSKEQWGNWYSSEKEVEVKNSIQKHIETKFPYGVYQFRLMGKGTTSDQLNLIKPLEIILYSEKDQLFCKIKGQEAIKFTAGKNNKTNVPCLKQEIFNQLKQALINEEDPSLHPTVLWHVMNFLSWSECLPHNFCVEKMSEERKNRRKTLVSLQDKAVWSWQWAKDKWEKIIIKDGKVKENIRESKKEDVLNLDKDEKLFFRLWTNAGTSEEYQQCLSSDSLTELLNKIKENIPSISNQSLKMVQESLEKILKKPNHTKEYIQYIKEVSQRFKDLSEDINFKIDFNDKAKPEVADIRDHRKKMAASLKSLLILKDEPQEKMIEYDGKEVEEYNKSYHELENLLSTNRDLEAKLDEVYDNYFTRISSSLTRIPTRRTFFGSDDPYGKPRQILYMSLRDGKLYDDSFVLDFHEDIMLAKYNNILTPYQEIDLSYNKITGTIPVPFSITLKKLNLQRNQLTSLKIVEDLKNLEALDVSHNHLTKLGNLLIADGLGKCTSLTCLNLAYNAIENIPILSKLTRLKVLNLSGHQLLFQENKKMASLDTLQKLSSLTFLTVQKCELTGSAEGNFPGLMNLGTLDVRENNLLVGNESNVRLSLPKVELIRVNKLDVRLEIKK